MQRKLRTLDSNRAVDLLAFDKAFGILLPDALLRVNYSAFAQVLGAPQQGEEGDQHGQEGDHAIVRRHVQIMIVDLQHLLNGHRHFAVVGTTLTLEAFR